MQFCSAPMSQYIVEMLREKYPPHHDTATTVFYFWEGWGGWVWIDVQF